MHCAHCGRAHGASARFCGGCGKPLARYCHACGAESRPDAQFCETCGAALAARVGDEGVARKVVTVVFADLIGSTALHERLDAESARRLMDRYYRALHAAVEAHGGTVVKLLGDGVMAAFGVPRVAEDDALRAVRAAVDMQRAFRELARGQAGLAGDVGLRVAVNTGEVVVSADHTDVVGDPVNVAARLQQEAHDGDVLVGEATRRLVGGLVTLASFGVLALKGRAETVTAYRVVSLERPAGAPAIAFVGRDDELRRLTAVYDAAVAAPDARFAVILGSPGLGKSRLLDEFARRLGDRAAVLGARCDAAGGATFAPVADALRAFLRIDDGADSDATRATIDAVLPRGDSERARVAAGIAALLARTPASPEETFFVIRRLLAALATVRPVVLAIDDLQWAEPLLLDLIEHLVQWSTGVPLLVLAAARPELRDTRSTLTTPGGLVGEVMTLSGLDAGAATRLAANVIGADELPAALAGRVLATSEGNPLFVGELVRMLVQDGALKREGDRWTTAVELAALEMPPTIHALLAARIERLRPEERTVLERAAVVGRHFSRAAVAHLLPGETGGLDARLESLQRSELIEPDVGGFLGEPALRFHHVLIRDAAYRRILKGTRAELHGHIADWIEGRAGPTVEQDETIGWHLEQAHQCLRELGPIDEEGRTLGERAAQHLAAAGRRALARDDVPLAANLLGRALDRLDEADPARADLALDWCEALLSAGDVGPATRAIAELGRFTGASERLRAWHTCFVGQLAAFTDPQALRATVGAVAAAADALAMAGDAVGEAKAHAVHATVLARLGKFGECEVALDRALAAARHAGDRRRANAVLAGAPLAALWGPSPVTRASGRCLDVVRVLRITQGAPGVEAVALRCQAVLEALRGRGEAARRMLASSRHLVEELGIAQRLLEADVAAGTIELLEGDAAGAERTLRAAYDGLRSQGLGIDAAQTAALLGRALLALGRDTEAYDLSRESEALAGDDLKAAIAWRGVRAEALARRGEHADAIGLARAAVEIAAATDALLDHADARLALGAVLRSAGRSAEADAEETRAIELWEAKGATSLAERARQKVGAVPPAASVRHEHAPEALARFDEAGPAVRFANAASRAFDAFMRAWRARDWEGVVATFTPTTRLIDRRSLTGVDLEGDDVLANFRFFFDLAAAGWHGELLATRGEQLALFRWKAEFEDDTTGPSEVEYCGLIEVDATGRGTLNVLFDLEALDAAYEELDDRYAAGEGAPYAALLANLRAFRAASAARDWETVARLLPEDFTLRSHRRLVGTGEPIGRDEYLATRGAVDDLGLHGYLRLDHVPRICGRAALGVVTWYGTVDGGAFENPFLCVYTHDGSRFHSLEIFDFDRLDIALARYGELAAEPPAVRFANAASRAVDRLERCWRERDWDGVVAAFVPTHRMDDRRKLVRLQLSGEEFFASMRMIFESAARWRIALLATRGERLALFRAHLTGEVGDSGPMEAELLWVVEVDAEGRRVALLAFDLEDLGAAYAELDARYVAGEAASDPQTAWSLAFRRAFAARDWDALVPLLAPDLIVNDHRLLGWETLRGPVAYVQALRSLVDLAPDVQLRIDHIERFERGALYVPVWQGTREGGAFETPSVFVSELDRQGRVRRFDQYDLDQLDEARARFEELATARAPTTYVANAATESLERFQDAWDARDWERIAALYAPGFRQSDRRSLMHLDLDRDAFLASLRMVFDMSSSAYTTRVLATQGERLVLARWQLAGTDHSVGWSEIEWLAVTEVDANGARRTAVLFDPDDLDAAHAELDALYDASEGPS